MSIAALLAGYRDGSQDPAEVVARAYERARSAAGPAWISLAPWSDVRRWLARPARGAARDLPLYGVPFAIKDNIDLAGTPTTAACPAFAYTPYRSAFVVQRLIAAGAIPIGKTNMDQFATGLTGTRTPYGACASVADPRYISGGSSSGSAVVVADGTVPFALGTDTAGSGRVPAAFNAIVGLKPSLGRIGTRGVVPACRSLDCVSLLTSDVADAARVLAVAGGRDPRRSVLARARPRTTAGRTAGCRRCGPGRRADRRPACPDGLTFGGDEQAAAAWQHAPAPRGRARLGRSTEIDFAPFAEAAALLYGGPWVAERYAAVGTFIAAHPEAVDPIVRDHHHGRPRHRRRRGVPRRAPPARARAAERRRLGAGRRAAAADRADAVHGGRDRRGADRAQRAARARTRTSSTCSTCARSRCPAACAPTACRSASR